MAKPTVVIPVNELNKFDLPPVCVITGKTKGVSFHPVKFSWYPRWVAIFVLGALLIAVILAAVLTRRVKGELPFSEEGYARWRRKKMIGTSLVLAAVASIIGCPLAFAADLPALGAILIFGFFGCLIAAIIANLAMPGVQCTRIDKENITLRIPSPEAAAQIQAHLHTSELQGPRLAARVT